MMGQISPAGFQSLESLYFWYVTIEINDFLNLKKKKNITTTIFDTSSIDDNNGNKNNYNDKSENDNDDHDDNDNDISVCMCKMLH